VDIRHKGGITMGVNRSPYIGAAYYPEAWPLEQIDEDIGLMKEAGMNVMRVAEFAWSRMEPEEGRFDFDWLHVVVDKLTEAGIAIIMCTPTCTPPVWVANRYPESIVMDDRGVRAQHGARRHACPNSPTYRLLCERIVTRMAEEFGEHDNIIGWQIDNELYPYGHEQGRGCCCPTCHRKFQEKMRTEFGNIDALNAAWGTNLWSQAYQSFAELSIPRRDTWHHPSLLTAWMNFQSDSYVEFAEFQADILHKMTGQPVGTDMMPFGGLNYHKIHRKLDMVQFNHYNNMDNLWEAAFWMDFIRPIKDAPFWNTETATCWPGSNAALWYNEPGFCRVNSWLPIALGGEANLYWLWRTHWSGQELMHGSVVSTSGRPMHIMGEVQEISRGFRVASEFLTHTRPKKTGLAMHFSGYAWWFYEFQPIVPGFRYAHKLLNSFYRPMIRAQMRPDVIDPATDLESYKLICSPFLPALDEAGFRSRIKNWIESGGTWVVGPLSDIRTMHATKYTHLPFGSLEDWAGIYCMYEVPGNPRDFSFQWVDGNKSQGSLWYSGFELRGGEALATFIEGPLSGLAAVAHRKMGKGQIVVLGTVPKPEDLQKLLISLGAWVEVMPVSNASPNLLVVPREGEGGRGLVVIELEYMHGSIRLDRAMVDILTGKEYNGEFEVEPYSVMVLVEC
jgi:beta-galactosidase